MTSEIINMLRGSSLVKKSIDLFVEMITTDEYLYNEAWRIITTEEKIEQIPQYFYNKDIHVNNLEKEKARLMYRGIAVVLSGKLENGDVFAYFDTRRVGNLMIKLVQSGT